MTGFLAAVALCAAINWHTLLFLVFAVVACTFAVAVVVTDNVVRMALHLVLSLAATAGLFFLAGADFIGAMQLMIYVGGTLVLLVFGVMLTAQAPFVSIRTSRSDRVLAGVVGAALLAVLLQAAFSVEAWRRPAMGTLAAPSATPLGMALMGMRVDDPPEGMGPTSAGLRSGYLLPFEIVSVHLLVVLIGAAYLARAKRRRTPRGVETAGELAATRAAASVSPGPAVTGRASSGVPVSGGSVFGSGVGGRP